MPKTHNHVGDYHHGLYSFMMRSELQDVRAFQSPHRWVIKPLVTMQQERFVSEQPGTRRYATEPFRYSSSPEVTRERMG